MNHGKQRTQTNGRRNDGPRRPRFHYRRPRLRHHRYHPGKATVKIAISLVLGFALGFLACFALFGRLTSKCHWKIVESYNAHVNDPASYKPDSTTGLSVTTPPGDPAPSLAALVAAGELSHVDLVLPTVPKSRDAERHWMKFCESHKEVVYITGNPSYTAFTPAGTEPLHLNIWFRDSDKGVVQTLIRELEERHGE